MSEPLPTLVEPSEDGVSTVSYWDVPVAGDRIEQLVTELFTKHWREVTVGPVIEGAAYEIRFTDPPRVSMLDGYVTIDTGTWHFHLCVNEHRGTRNPELARIRRVGRAAFFRADGGTCLPATWGLRLWNGRGEQMISAFFPNPFFDETTERRTDPPHWEKTALWEDLRRRYAPA